MSRPVHRRLVSVVTTAVLLLASAAPAWAADKPFTLEQVVGKLRTLLMTLLVGLATLFLTIGGVRYLTAAREPTQVEKAKVALRSAAVGYALAVLAPTFVDVLRSVVGG